MKPQHTHFTAIAGAFFLSTTLGLSEVKAAEGEDSLQRKHWNWERFNHQMDSLSTKLQWMTDSLSDWSKHFAKEFTLNNRNWMDSAIIGFPDSLNFRGTIPPGYFYYHNPKMPNMPNAVPEVIPFQDPKEGKKGKVPNFNGWYYYHMSSEA